MISLLAAGLYFLPHSIHAPYYADTREPTSWVTLHTNDVVEAALSKEVCLVGQDQEGLHWRFSFSGGSFMGFRNSQALAFGLETFDGLITLPLDVHYNQIETRLSLGHLSSHTADGIRVTEAHSREWIQLQSAYRFSYWRPYVGARVITHAIDDGSGAQFQAGWTMETNRETGPYVGFDARAAHETDWQLTASAQGGVYWDPPMSIHNFRFGVIWYKGLQDAGKWVGQPEEFIGLTLGFDESVYKGE